MGVNTGECLGLAVPERKGAVPCEGAAPEATFDETDYFFSGIFTELSVGAIFTVLSVGPGFTYS